MRLTELRERFGTLVGVDRPAQNGDFVSLDLVATIGDEEIESVEGTSYQIGEGNMLEGLDEALIGLSAEETTTFTSKLAGGDHAGEEAQIKVVPQSVKVRELPDADDEFAELASEFDTIDELKDDLRQQAAADAEGNRVALARNALLEKLLEELEIPVPEALVEDEINAHLENEGKEPGDPHGEEIREDTAKAVRAQFLLDEINGTREVSVEQDDLMAYMTQLSAQYGIEQNQLLQMLAQSGQLEQIFGEVQRSKALEVVLADVTVKNASGDVLDLGLTAQAADADGADAESTDDAADAEKAPAKKAPAKKPAARGKKAPAKKAAGQEGRSLRGRVCRGAEATEKPAAEEGGGQEGTRQEGSGQEGGPKKAVHGRRGLREVILRPG